MRGPRPPSPQPYQVAGRSSRQMLQIGLCEPDITRLPEATPADALRMGALDACPRGILLIECFGCLPLPCCLQGLILLPRLESQEAWLLLGPRTLRPVGARRAIFAGKAHLPHHALG